MKLKATLILLCSICISTLSQAQSLVTINQHQQVIQAITTSDNPLNTWLKIEHQSNNPAAAEKTAYIVLNYLQQMPVQPIYEPLLKHWQNHQTVATILNDHGHQVARYNMAARASGELNRLLSEQTERYIFHISNTRPEHLIDEITYLYQQQDPAILRGLEGALKHLYPNHQKELVDQLLNTAKPSAITPFIAMALDSRSLQSMLLQQGQSHDIRTLFNAWKNNPSKYTQLIKQAAQNTGPHQQQAIALMAMLDLNKTDTDWLFTLLNDTKLGRTAARTLGHKATPEIVERLFSNWLQEEDKQRNTHLLYALSRTHAGLNKLKPLLKEKSTPLGNQQKIWLQQQMENSHEK